MKSMLLALALLAGSAEAVPTKPLKLLQANWDDAPEGYSAADPFEVDGPGAYLKLKDATLYKTTTQESEKIQNCADECDADDECAMFILHYRNGLCKMFKEDRTDDGDNTPTWRTKTNQCLRFNKNPVADACTYTVYEDTKIQGYNAHDEDLNSVYVYILDDETLEDVVARCKTTCDTMGDNCVAFVVNVESVTDGTYCVMKDEGVDSMAANTADHDKHLYVKDSGCAV